MIGKLDPEENVLEWFEQTSNKPYDKHNYELVYTNGSSKVFDNYEDFRKTWWETPEQFLSHGHVLDKKVTQVKSRGFK